MPHSTLVTKLASPWVAAQTTSRTSPGPWGFLWITVSSRVPLLRTGRPRGSVWKTCLTSSWRSSSRTGPRPGLWIRARPWGPCCTTSTRRPDSHQGEISTIRRLWIISTYYIYSAFSVLCHGQPTLENIMFLYDASGVPVDAKVYF